MQMISLRFQCYWNWCKRFFYYSSACPTPRKTDLNGRAQTIPDKR